MEVPSILNYPGSKRRLLDFIYENSKHYIDENKAVLDIFSGTGVVASHFKAKGFKVLANDAEVYSSHICNALLNGFDSSIFDDYTFRKAFLQNKEILLNEFKAYVENEDFLIKSSDIDLCGLYDRIPKIWSLPQNFTLCGCPINDIDDLNKNINIIPFSLFSLYYSGSYFGLRQSIDIDSLRFAIEQICNDNNRNKSVLLACLYYAMKEASFSKDGHMAQPLNKEKNFNRLIKTREKDIFYLFEKELNLFKQIKNSRTYSEVRNESFLDLINNNDYLKNVGLIYADPPYTDMQYSRYFHLLTTITNYSYPKLTYKNGNLTTGLYADNRFQSTISNHSRALIDLNLLISKASSLGIPIVFSYAFPIDRDNQPIDRYTMNIDDLIKSMNAYYPEVKTIKENFKHCNNRNSSKKNVYEYLIIGIPLSMNRIESNYQYELFPPNEETSLNSLKEHLSAIKATNKSPLYNTMLYWSQKPYNITDVLIDRFSGKNDIVLDPFMGSGVTILEASNRIFNRKSIGVEINDFPIFLCKQSVFTPSQKTIHRLNDFAKDLEKYKTVYSTKNEKDQYEEATIIKTVYDTKPRLFIREIYYKTNNSENIYVKKPSSEDYQRFSKNYSIQNINDISLIENSRIAVKKGEKVSDKFSKRNFYALDIIKGLINQEKDVETKKVLTYIFASIIHKTKILDIKLSSQWPLWVPHKNCVERNVFLLFIESLNRFILSRADVKKTYKNSFVENYSELKPGSSLIIQKGIQNVSEIDIPNGSINLVVTDPPYLGQVPYSEYMQLYKPFLDNNINFEDEIVITNAKSRNKDYDLYFSMMGKAFLNISRMLKWDAHVCMYFHDSDLIVWKDLIETLHKSNIVFEGSIHIDKSQKTLKKILDPKKTMSGETLLLFRKAKIERHEREFSTKDYDVITQIAESIISRNPCNYATTSQLYDNGVLDYIINEGILSSISKVYKDLTELFIRILEFDTELGIWKKKGIK